MSELCKLARKIRVTLDKQNTESDFATAAEDSIRKNLPECDLSYTDLLVEAINAPSQFKLSSPKFGEPALMLEEADNYYIEAILWRNLITSIHDHAFSGAFTALSGRRLQAIYQYTNDIQFECGFQIGKVELKSLEIVSPGDLRVILSGENFIHGVWYIDKPASTLVVRQYRQPNRVQFSYLPPSVRYIPAHAEKELSNRLEYLWALRDIAYSSFIKEICGFALSSSFNTITRLALEFRKDLMEGELSNLFWQILSRRHLEVSANLRYAINEYMRGESLTTAKLSAVTPAQRFVLGLAYYKPHTTRDIIPKLLSTHEDLLLEGFKKYQDKIEINV